MANSKTKSKVVASKAGSKSAASKAVKSTAKSKSNHIPCITPGCAGCQHSRGLCQSCYQVAKRFVWRGIVTMVDLEKLGMVLPPKHGGAQGRFYEEFNRLAATKTGKAIVSNGARSNATNSAKAGKQFPHKLRAIG